MSNKRVTIAVIDTVGSVSDLHSGFVGRHEGVVIRGNEPPGYYEGAGCHPHGTMAADKILQALSPANGVDYQLEFMRIFTKTGGFIPRAFKSGWVFNMLRKFASQTDVLYVNNSWGANIGAKTFSKSDKLEAQAWRDFIADTGAVVVWAAGNEGDFFADNDDNAPQAMLTDVSLLVGSRDRRGIPSKFSSDSHRSPPFCVMWGEDLRLWNGVRNRWDRGSGTSFAAPKLTGLLAAKGYTRERVRELIPQFSRPTDYPENKLPHAKWGYGDGEALYQELLKGETRLQMTTPQALTAGVTWFDFNEIGG